MRRPRSSPGRRRTKEADVSDRFSQMPLDAEFFGPPPDQREFTTVSGEPVQPVYTPADLQRTGFRYERDLGDPGQFPYTRGVHQTAYRGKLWTIRMFAGFGSAEETNARFRYLLEHGESGLSIAFDLPTLYGRDTDDPLAGGAG